MHLQNMNSQRGITFLGLVFMAIVLGLAGVVIAQVVPTLIEYGAITKAATKAAHEGSSVIEVRQIFDKASTIDDFKSISGKDLEVGKEGDKIVVHFSYTKEIPIGGPAYLLLKYSGQSK